MVEHVEVVAYLDAVLAHGDVALAPKVQVAHAWFGSVRGVPHERGVRRRLALKPPVRLLGHHVDDDDREREHVEQPAHFTDVFRGIYLLVAC